MANLQKRFVDGTKTDSGGIPEGEKGEAVNHLRNKKDYCFSRFTDG